MHICAKHMHNKSASLLVYKTNQDCLFLLICMCSELREREILDANRRNQLMEGLKCKGFVHIFGPTRSIYLHLFLFNAFENSTLA